MKRRLVMGVVGLSALAGVLLAARGVTSNDVARPLTRPEAARPAPELPDAHYLELQQRAQRQPSGVRRPDAVRVHPVVADPER